MSRTTNRAEALRLDPSTGPDAVLRAVSVRYGETIPRLLMKCRTKHLSHARHVAAWLMRQGGMSYPEIGRALGGRDHTTAMNSVGAVEEEIQRVSGLREELEKMIEHGAESTVRVVPGEGAMLSEEPQP